MIVYYAGVPGGQYPLPETFIDDSAIMTSMVEARVKKAVERFELIRGERQVDDDHLLFGRERPEALP